MKFNQTVFERLLFPLHNRVYKEIQETVDITNEKHPGKLNEILKNYKESSNSDTQTSIWRSGKAEDVTYPSLDIYIRYEPKNELKISSLHKSADYKIAADYQENSPAKYRGNHLTVGFYKNKVLNSFIVPLEYLLGFNEKSVLKEGSYQLYSHTILSQENKMNLNNQIENIIDKVSDEKISSLQRYHQKNSLLYVGITKRTWQERYKEHCYSMKNGSNLRFHRALRGELCAISTIEHIVERAGLTEHQALELEEKDVEKRSLFSLHPNGLNMIPGGYAGFKYIHQYALRTGFKINKKIVPDNFEDFLVEIQGKALESNFKTSDIKKINAVISRLWAEDIDFRINATTKQRNRFSYVQIQAARIWHASGWSKEKILEHLHKMDTRKVSMEQLERLLDGKTYAAIPDVLV